MVQARIDKIVMEGDLDKLTVKDIIREVEEQLLPSRPQGVLKPHKELLKGFIDDAVAALQSRGVPTSPACPTRPPSSPSSPSRFSPSRSSFSCSSPSCPPSPSSSSGS